MSEVIPNPVYPEVECNSCPWVGYKVDLELSEESSDVSIYSCPDCGSEDLYYFI
jgi:Zn finger protein HypA/HybF involved in hydrogenase expression